MPTSHPKFVLVATLLAAFCVAQAHAQDAATSSEKPKKIEKFTEKFGAADSNHDGFLTRDEATQGLPRIARHFDAVDTDHDGKLSPQEVARFLAAKRKARED
ncbi:MAG TPA: EF-hand domain-containing protein [Rudaea sp.]|nr:EF-hand domain-containing protein [Rudaea sp.]